MRVFHRLLLLVAAIILVSTTVTAPRASAATPVVAGPAAGKVNAATSHGCSTELYQGDQRLGPKVLSNSGLTGAELVGYRRTGNLTVQKFLATYWDATLYEGQGGWLYPKNDGFLSDAEGKPIKWAERLTRGKYLDRFGSEYGAFLAPTGISYSSRAIPPSSLVGSPANRCNYSNYRVLKAFTVSAGPIAPWFGQPGRGTQYQLKSELIDGAPAQLNVLWLVNEGYLQRVPVTQSAGLH